MIKVRFQANKRLDLKLMSLCSVEPIITGIPISREHIYAQCLKKSEFLAKKKLILADFIAKKTS